jgi:hypothetical protein
MKVVKAAFNDHIITTRSVFTDGGDKAPVGTHGFILRVLNEPDERYVAELHLDEDYIQANETALAVLLPTDFELA